MEITIARLANTRNESITVFRVFTKRVCLKLLKLLNELLFVNALNKTLSTGRAYISK